MNIRSAFDETIYVASLDKDASEATLRKCEKDIHSLLTKPLPQASVTKPSPSYYMPGVGTGKIASLGSISHHKCIFIQGFVDMKRLEAIRQLNSINSCEKQDDVLGKDSARTSDDAHFHAK